MKFFSKPATRWGLLLAAVILLGWLVIWLKPKPEVAAARVVEPPPPGAASKDLVEGNNRTQRTVGETITALDGITLAQLTPWLDRCGRSAETLVAAWELTNDPTLEAELADKFAGNPLVCLALLAGKDSKLNAAWVERLRLAAPDHPLPDCLDAAAAAKAGDFPAVKAALALALSKHGRRDLMIPERMTAVREAAAAAGLSEMEVASAPGRVMSKSVTAPFEVAKGAHLLVKSAKGELAAGNLESSQERASAAISLAHITQSSRGSILDDLVRISILKASAKILPPETEMGDSGLTLNEVISKNAGDLDQIMKHTDKISGAMEYATPAEITAYWDHYMQGGEASAQRWALQRIQAQESSGVPVPPQ